jgi:hypothetical protein
MAYVYEMCGSRVSMACACLYVCVVREGVCVKEERSHFSFVVQDKMDKQTLCCVHSGT